MTPVRIRKIEGKDYILPVVAREKLNIDAEVYALYVAQGILRVKRFKTREWVDLDSVERILRQRQLQAKAGG